MVKSILVGVNGTRFSQAAVRYAIEMAKNCHASLIAVGIVDTPRLAAPESVPLGAGTYKAVRDDAVLQKEHQSLDQWLADAEELCRAAGVPTQTVKVEGDPAEILVLESQRVDLLVLGKKHLAEDDWEATTHTLRSVLRHSPRPTLCIPENPARGEAALVAFDGSLQAAKALHLFVVSGMASGRDLHLLTVADDAPAVAQRAIEFLHAHDLRVSTHIEDGDHAAEHILQTSAGLNAGLIVMGAYGKPRIREFVFGSVTKTILRTTKTPLFLYH